MPVWLIKWLPEIATALVVGFLALQLHNGAMAQLRLDQTKELTQQAKNLKDECQKQKDITTEISNDLHKENILIRRKLVKLNNVRDGRCVAVSRDTVATGGNDGSPSTGKPVGQNGLTTDFLYDFAAEGEFYRQRLIACQDFVKKTIEFNK